MPLLRLLFLVVPIARRLLRDPRVRARLGLDRKTSRWGRARGRARGRGSSRRRR